MAPDLVSLFHLTYTGLGTLIGAFMLLGMVVGLPLGRLGRRFGDRPVLASGLALMVVARRADQRHRRVIPSGHRITGPHPTLAGVGGVAMIVLQGKIIADFFTGKRFMIGISVSVCAYPIGVGLSQLVLPVVSSHLGWQAALLTVAVAPAAALLTFLLSYRQRATAVTAPGISLPSRRECTLLVIGGLIWTAYTSGYSGYTSYVPSALAARGDSVEMIGLVLVVATWGNVPATLWGGDLAARFGGLRERLRQRGAGTGRRRHRAHRWRRALVVVFRRRAGIDPPGRHHGGRHAVGPAGEPGGRHGPALPGTTLATRLGRRFAAMPRINSEGRPAAFSPRPGSRASPFRYFCCTVSWRGTKPCWRNHKRPRRLAPGCPRYK